MVLERVAKIFVNQVGIRDSSYLNLPIWIDALAVEAPKQVITGGRTLVV